MRDCRMRELSRIRSCERRSRKGRAARRAARRDYQVKPELQRSKLIAGAHPITVRLGIDDAGTCVL